MAFHRLPIVLAVPTPDGSHDRIETSAAATYDDERQEIVFAWKDSTYTGELFAILLDAWRASEVRSGFVPSSGGFDDLPPFSA